MPTLKEIKGRIASVRSTLKITSAMKLVSSAKLRKAQRAIEAMRPYEAHLQAMLDLVSGGPGAFGPAYDGGVSVNMAKFADREAFSGAVSVNTAGNADKEAKSGALSVERGLFADRAMAQGSGVTAIVAVASNSSLCGGFNANVIAKVREVRRPGDVVYAIGRKMADAMRKDGFPSPADFSALAEHPAYAPAAELFEQLAADLEAGRISRVLLVYNHFASTARQVPVVEPLLSAPAGWNAGQEAETGDDSFLETSLRDPVRANVSRKLSSPEDSTAEVILEPGREELVQALRPKTLKLKLYAALLDSAAAEHAARTIAMQTATDNGENLLAELTLQYNKGRQQKITAEILDLAGGQAAE